MIDDLNESHLNLIENDTSVDPIAITTSSDNYIERQLYLFLMRCNLVKTVSSIFGTDTRREHGCKAPELRRSGLGEYCSGALKMPDVDGGCPWVSVLVEDVDHGICYSESYICIPLSSFSPFDYHACGVMVEPRDVLKKVQKRKGFLNLAILAGKISSSKSMRH